MQFPASLKTIYSLNLADPASFLPPGFTAKAFIENDGKDLPMGNTNIHVPIVFDDGVQWLARLPLSGFRSPPLGMHKMVYNCLPATCNYMSKAGLKVPAVHKPSPLSEQEAPIHDESNPCLSQISSTIEGLADFSIQLSALPPFRAFGSLFSAADDSDRPIVGPLLAEYMGFPFPPHYIGPFATAKARWLGCIDAVLLDIKQGLAFQDVPLRTFLFHLEVREMVVASDKIKDVDEDCYITHPDDHGGHVMMDDEGRVTGIIDWDWAFTSSKEEAFAAPQGLMDVIAFFDGSNTLSKYEISLRDIYLAKGHPDLAKCVEGSCFYRRLKYAVGEDFKTIKLDALREVMGLEKHGMTEEEWEDWALERFGDVEGLDQVKALQKEVEDAKAA
ncbi:hypothetical protein IAR50_007451 [Cryptococcus sp. DSM 104548]